MKLKLCFLSMFIIAVIDAAKAQPPGVVLPKISGSPFGLGYNGGVYGYIGQGKDKRIAKALSSSSNMAAYEASQNFKFFVYFKDGTQKEIKGSIFKDTITDQVTLRYKKKGSKEFSYVLPKETYGISRTYDDGEVRYAGTPADSCWYFKILDGHLNAYTIWADADVNYSSQIKAISLESGPIQLFNPKLLLHYVGNIPKAKKYFDTESYIDAIKEYNYVSDHTSTKN